MPETDLYLHKEIHNKEQNMPLKIIVHQSYNNMTQIYTEGSKHPKSGRTSDRLIIYCICIYDRIDSFIPGITVGG